MVAAPDLPRRLVSEGLGTALLLATVIGSNPERGGTVVNNVVFACVQSAGRSQMAAAWFNHFAHRELARATSAGTRPAAHVHPVVAEAMKEVGLDLSQARPQLLTETLV